MWRGCALSEELNLCARAEIPGIGIRIEHCAAGNGVLLGRVPYHEAIAHKRQNRRLELEAGDCALPGGKCSNIQKCDLRRNATCPEMNLNRAAVSDWAGRRRVPFQARRSFRNHVQRCARTAEVRKRNQIAPLYSVLID